MEENYGGYLLPIVVILVVGVVQQPRMDGGTIAAGDHVRFEGDVVFGGRAIASGILGGAARYSADCGEV